jgi:lipoprotein-anchoring transpeptidase ErfK/SrfK
LWCIAPWHGGDEANTIVIATKERALYVVNEGSVTATRFPIAVGKEGFAWTGVATVGEKKKNPTWTPPAEMIERKPELEEWAHGMPGGIPENPLGTRAFYLYDAVDGGDTLYRIHGTNAPESIGTAASSGCIRMLNAHAEWLYERVQVGARVVVAESLDQDMAELME